MSDLHEAYEEMNKRQPRRHSNVSCPRDLRMPLNRAIDVIAWKMGSQEGAERAPSAATWEWIVGVLTQVAEGWKNGQYQPSKWLVEKERNATQHTGPV